VLINGGLVGGPHDRAQTLGVTTTRTYTLRRGLRNEFFRFFDEARGKGLSAIVALVTHDRFKLLYFDSVSAHGLR